MKLPPTERRFILLIILLFALGLPLRAQVSITAVAPMSSSATHAFAKFEVGVALSGPQIINPYDEQEVAVIGEFMKADGTQLTEVQGFWYQPYERHPEAGTALRLSGDALYYDNPEATDPGYLTPSSTSTYSWRIRYAFPSAGTWQYRIRLVTSSGTSYWPANGYVTVPVNTPRATTSSAKGYIRVHANKRNFEFSNGGDIFFPVGANGVMQGTLNYNRVPYTQVIRAIDLLAEDAQTNPLHGNMLRIWMTPELFGVEWSDGATGGLGQYTPRQNRAFDLDQIVEHASTKGVYIQLCLESFTAYTNPDLTNSDPNKREADRPLKWDNNPYKTILGGNSTPVPFFSDPTAINFFKRRLRYITSRWGYSTSLLSYEMFNEVEQTLGQDFYDLNNAAAIRNWHDDVIAYAKRLDDRHLFTTSTLAPYNGNYGHAQGMELFKSPVIDYAQEHTYIPLYNVGYNLSYILQRAHKLYDKPVLLGEFGEHHHPKCTTDSSKPSYFGTSNFPVGTTAKGHGLNELHNSLWSTAFSGAAGPASYWWVNHLFANWGTASHFKPVAQFFSETDVLKHPYKPIGNRCLPLSSGASDIYWRDNGYFSTKGTAAAAAAERDYKNGNISLSIPYFNLFDDADNTYIVDGIVTSNDDKIEAFALKGEESIIGWVHLKDNYWYNLPNTLQCPGIKNDTPLDPATRVPAIPSSTITFTGLACDGVYKVEFYSTYSNYPTGGTVPEGGKIPSFTIDYAPAYCGTLQFQLPRLQALGTAPYAPDYAFKITKTQSSWIHAAVGPQSYGVKGTIAASNGTHDIFYQGTDNRLHHLWQSQPLTWQHEWLTNWNNTSQNVEGDIVAATDGKVFYRGVDGRLHLYYYGALNGVSGWHHRWLTDWARSDTHVGGGIAVSADVSSVYYANYDQDLRQWFYNSALPTPDWESRPVGNPNTINDKVLGDALAVAVTDSGKEEVFFQGADDRVHKFSNTGGTWQNLFVSGPDPAENIFGDIGVSANGNHVYYRGTDGRLHLHRPNASPQNQVVTANGIGTVMGDLAVSSNGAHVFYRSTDNYIHQVYQVNDGRFGHDWVVCTTDLSTAWQAESSISYGADGVFYAGSTSSGGQVQAFFFDAGCTPRALRAGAIPPNGDVAATQKKPREPAPAVLSGSLFPNPFKESITLDFSGQATSVVLVNALGQHVLEQAVRGQQTELRTAHLPAGLYFVQVKNGDRIVAKYKVYKQE